MLMENNGDELERHKAVTVSLASTTSSSSSVPSPPLPQKIAAANNTTTSMSSAATEPHPSSSLKRPHTVAPSIMADIEQTITVLLTYTKKFLEALTAWSLGQMMDVQVMSVYKDLASQFERVKQALQAAPLTVR
ncbi:hypothetical protein BDB00DRAFT_786024 [Zychaea mexicana]|uniref:uncharacterized protein n=1 Tax=Zychaea mexicana TaxID=64656 RepID=UPI0022FDF020|nr:uncharacterized protein BDB00DRAFT_786024 [Zychaea mexicana]KAI9495783.1 hypothetical protein BDB00DRAFT_786024 [Zychaea mexicana]